MVKKPTIKLNEEVDQEPHAAVGPHYSDRSLNNLPDPHGARGDLDADYAAMATDEEREAEALVWIEAFIADIADDPR